MPTPTPKLTRREAVTLLALGFPVAARAIAAEPSSQELFREAVKLFFEAKPVESARTFDQLLLAVPGAEPELWQRGLALYYAKRYDDGRKQFELHRTVNPNDVENPAWHFLCVARLEGVEATRGELLPVGEDSRVPMQEILGFYAGRCGPEKVLATAEKGEGEARRPLHGQGGRHAREAPELADRRAERFTVMVERPRDCLSTLRAVS